ncbi:helix-turn-helix domain-containing protein [Haloarcula marismortui]|uniref:helix-turn-helix domain-containing protein n=1 Tax=Haloarcula marismortui TaxID=2238 RepID=UPI0013765814|nr:winged helix-turn-helix domain-containing protein [Haloarcula californiae]
MVSETVASPRQRGYGVEYHETYAYDLLKEAGLSLRTARPQHHEADPEEKAEFQETVEKNGPN